jgi:hypothetical protein
MDKDNNTKFSRIRKVTQSSSLHQVNLLLDKGWTILEIQKKNDGYPNEPSEIVIYHLGHTDPKAEEYKEHNAFEGL